MTLLQDKQFWTSLSFYAEIRPIFVTLRLFILAFILALLVNGAFGSQSILDAVFLLPWSYPWPAVSWVWYGCGSITTYMVLWIIFTGGRTDRQSYIMRWIRRNILRQLSLWLPKMSGFSMLIILRLSEWTTRYMRRRGWRAGWIAVFQNHLPIIKPQVLALIMSVTGSVLAFEQFSIMTRAAPVS